ncbi:MAG: FlgD immunoglobulin-like domain containing protein [Campylobacterota bacterium]|nr:FlgD immunoglobulin-like domain containing protein [Campylobacterota bacterium]
MITSTGENAATTAEYKATTVEKDNSVLGKDDFMALLLVQLQNQDPTEPTDTATILTQTSQLASLESAENTNNSLEGLSTTLGASQEFSTIAAIGKMADLGGDVISHDEGTISTFEIYFSDDIEQGSVNITDNNGNVVQTIDIPTASAGVHKFNWDGKDSAGNIANSGVYSVTANYINSDQNSLSTRLGVYPIESIKFDNGKSLAKVGSNYVPIESISEIY